jgi:hypothetical protein
VDGVELVAVSLEILERVRDVMLERVAGLRVDVDADDVEAGA